MLIGSDSQNRGEADTVSQSLDKDGASRRKEDSSLARGMIGGNGLIEEDGSSGDTDSDSDSSSSSSAMPPKFQKTPPKIIKRNKGLAEYEFDSLQSSKLDAEPEKSDVFYL